MWLRSDSHSSNDRVHEIQSRAAKSIDQYIRSFTSYTYGEIDLTDLCVISAYVVNRIANRSFNRALKYMQEILGFKYDAEYCIDIAVRRTGIDIDGICNSISADKEYRKYIVCTTQRFMEQIKNDVKLLHEIKGIKYGWKYEIS